MGVVVVVVVEIQTACHDPQCYQGKAEVVTIPLNNYWPNLFFPLSLAGLIVWVVVCVCVYVCVPLNY